MSGYMGDIEEWFAGGCNEKGSKRSAEQVREGLLSKYHRHYDVPMEFHIASAISRLHVAKAAVKRNGARSGDETVDSERRGVPVKYAEMLCAIICYYTTLKPNSLVGELRRVLFSGEVAMKMSSKANFRYIQCLNKCTTWRRIFISGRSLVL